MNFARYPFSFWVVFVTADLGFVFTLLLSLSYMTDLGIIQEPIRLFMGLPIYYSEFLLFLIISVVAVHALAKATDVYRVHMITGAMSVLGVFCSGVYAALEMNTLVKEGMGAYTLLAPTSVYSLVLFMLSFLASALSLSSRPE